MAEQEYPSNKGINLESVLVEVNNLSSTQIRTLVEALHTQQERLKATPGGSADELNKIARLESDLKNRHRIRES